MFPEPCRRTSARWPGLPSRPAIAGRTQGQIPPAYRQSERSPSKAHGLRQITGSGRKASESIPRHIWIAHVDPRWAVTSFIALATDNIS